MKISLNLLESNAVIRDRILKTLSNNVEKTIVKSISDIKSQIKIVVSEALKQEPEYSSLISGKLRAEFGIADPQSVDEVIDVLVNTIKVNFSGIKITNMGLSGGFELTMMKSDDLGGALAIDAAYIHDALGGYSLPWLEWLLLRNNEIIVKNYTVRYMASPRSRSGMALMYNSKQNWRVPAEFSGSQNNNWTTRAIDRCEQQIYDIIRKTIEVNI